MTTSFKFCPKCGTARVEVLSAPLLASADPGPSSSNAVLQYQPVGPVPATGRRQSFEISSSAALATGPPRLPSAAQDPAPDSALPTIVADWATRARSKRTRAYVVGAVMSILILIGILMGTNVICVSSCGSGSSSGSGGAQPRHIIYFSCL